MFWGLHLLRSAAIRYASGLLGKKAFVRYQRCEIYTYLVFSLPLLGYIGVLPSILLFWVTTAFYLILQLALIAFSSKSTGSTAVTPSGKFALLFLISGASSLMYQIVWQRVLFAAYGINIETVTLIVSVFMFGLGIGALLGGYLSQKFERKLVLLFILCEVSIGLFGIISIPLLKTVAAGTVHYSLVQTIPALFFLLCVPTIFMGATLPILTAHFHGYFKNVGKSVGVLYFCNTLGAATACILTVDIFFLFFGQNQTILIAVILNLMIAVLAWLWGGSQKAGTSPEHVKVSQMVPVRPLSYALILALSMTAGFISLSQEILWVRFVSYMSQSRPHVFAHVLGFFLLGISMGAKYAERLSIQSALRPIVHIGKIYAVNGLLFPIGFFVIGEAAQFDKTYAMGLAYTFIFINAFLTGQIFPLLCHFGINREIHVGAPVSRIYLANIIGSTIGPLLMGFFLLQYFSLKMNILLMGWLGLLLSGSLMLHAPGLKGRIWRMGGVAVLSGLCLVAVGEGMRNVLEKVHFGSDFSLKGPYKYLHENRSGIIAVNSNESGDIIYGGGAYDGHFANSIREDSNGIARTYMVAAIHPDPKKVLVMGLASGSWVWVLSQYEKIERLTVVEINPGYAGIVSRYPPYNEILNHPKVHLHFTDIRRWLLRHPDEKFDLIVANVTHNWRSNTTSLLSAEFLRVSKDHLNPGGVLYYNSTGSEHVPHTAARNFKHVTTYSNFVAASDHPFSLSEEHKRKNLSLFTRDEQPLLDTTDTAIASIVQAMASHPLDDQVKEWLLRTDLREITDANMLTEFRMTRLSWFNRRLAWRRGW